MSCLSCYITTLVFVWRCSGSLSWKRNKPKPAEKKVEWESSEVKWLAIGTLICLKTHTHTHPTQGTQWGMQPRCHGDQKPSDASLPRARTQRGAVCSSPWPISLATVISPQSGLHYSLDSLLADGQVSCPIHSWPYQHGEEGHSVNTGLGFM